MDNHITNDTNNPINNWSDAELCGQCNSELIKENGELICDECDKCIYCGEILNECSCIDNN